MHSKSKDPNEQVLEIDGKFFPIKDLPANVTELLKLFTIWEEEKAVAVREVQKVDAALKSVSQEIASRMALWQAQQASNDPDKGK
jgi:hypothetical protein